MSSTRARNLRPPASCECVSRGRLWRYRLAPILGVVLVFGLAGCDQLGIDTPQKAAARQEADAKAIGGACRHAMRAIEDCYTLNPKAEKAPVYEGWREMDEYMRENKLEGIAPVIPKAAAAASKAQASHPHKSDDDADEGDEPASAPKGGKKASAAADE